MQWMQHSFLNSSTFLRVPSKCFTRVSALALVAFSVSTSRVAYCSTSIDVSSVTNRYFVDYDDFESFRQGQISDVDQLLVDAYAVSNELSAARSSSLAALLRAQSAQRQVELHQIAQGDSVNLRLATNYLGQSISNTELAIDSCDQSLSDVDGIISQLQVMKSTLEDTTLPTYQIVVQEGSGGGVGGGCSCPDYTSILTAISQSLSTISSTLTQLEQSIDLYFLNAIWNFFYTSEDALGNPDAYDDNAHGLYLGEYVGHVLSNAWASASPDSFLHRTQRYSQYIDNDAPIDLEPEPNEVAADVPLVAIIGLLYRIQHKLYQTNVADVVTGWREEEQQQIEEKEEEVEETSADITLDDVPEMPSSAIPFSDLFHIFELLNTALDNILKNLPNIQVGTLIVVDHDGFDVNLGYGAATDVVSRPLHFSPPSSEESSDLASGFILLLSGLFSVVWYALGGLVALLLSQWLFKLLVSAISLAFSVIGGDFSMAVRLLERFGSHFAGGS